MFSALSTYPDHEKPGGFAFTTRLGPRGRDAMIAAAAEMALADGRAEAVEHRGLLRFLKQHKMLLSLGRADTTERYGAEVRRAAQRLPQARRGILQQQSDNGQPDDRWQDLTNRVRPLAGTQSAHLVAAAAAFVAAADGVMHSGEIELLRSLRDTLGLEPAA